MKFNNIIIWLNIAILFFVVSVIFFFARYSPKTIVSNCKSKLDVKIPLFKEEDITSVDLVKDIFFPNRKEVEVEPAQKPTVIKKMDGPTIIYKGMILWDERKVGIFYDANLKKTLFLKKGDFIKDYKILDITQEEVVLSKKGGLSVVTLKIGGLGGL